MKNRLDLEKISHVESPINKVHGVKSLSIPFFNSKMFKDGMEGSLYTYYEML